jgi:hypothetical protein
MTTESNLQECADCRRRFPVEQRKGARDGRWLCPNCFNEKHGNALMADASAGRLQPEDPNKHKVGA